MDKITVIKIDQRFTFYVTRLPNIGITTITLREEHYDAGGKPYEADVTVQIGELDRSKLIAALSG